MIAIDDSVDAALIEPILGEYREMPGLALTIQVAIRTNCPGRLRYRIDDRSEETGDLVAVGGVMAGARRFQVTLGPFPVTANRLTFRFRCEHSGCDGRAPCCAGEPQKIRFRRARARAPRGSPAPSASRPT